MLRVDRAKGLGTGVYFTFPAGSDGMFLPNFTRIHWNFAEFLRNSVTISHYLGFRETPANFREIGGEKRPLSLKFQQKSVKCSEILQNCAKIYRILQNIQIIV
tara:strand:+ start:524 stop:832 length:309 start_codon:yes stop_codon:yes gene_type:complete